MRATLTAITLVSSLTQLFVTFHIYKIGRKNLSYLLFFWLSLVTLCWAILNYISILFIDSHYLTYIVRSIMLFAVIQIALFYVFTCKFPNASWNKLDRHLLRYVLITLFVGVVTISPFMFESVSVIQGTVNTNVGGGILVFAVYLLLSVISAFKSLIQKHQTSSGLQRTQLAILLFAACLNWVIIPATNFVATLTLHTPVFAAISPIYSLAFSCIIAYALSKHHLFDIRKSLRDSIIHVDHVLKNQQNRTLQYFLLQTLVYRSSSNYVALDFTNVKNLDKESIALFSELRNYMEQQGKQIYFIGYSQKVFMQLRHAINLQIFYNE